MPADRTWRDMTRAEVLRARHYRIADMSWREIGALVGWPWQSVRRAVGAWEGWLPDARRLEKPPCSNADT